MKPSCGLWIILLVYFVTLLVPAQELKTTFVASNCVQSCLSADMNEIDHEQMTIRTKNGSFSISTNTFQEQVADIVPDLSTYPPVQKFYFLDLPPYNVPLRVNLHPPICLS